MEPALAVQEFLEYVVAGLIQHPDEASVLRDEFEGTQIYRIRLHPEDTGRVIGRNGKTIQAIHSLALASAEKNGLRIDVEVEKRGDLRDEG